MIHHFFKICQKGHSLREVPFRTRKRVCPYNISHFYYFNASLDVVFIMFKKYKNENYQLSLVFFKCQFQFQYGLVVIYWLKKKASICFSFLIMPLFTASVCCINNCSNTAEERKGSLRKGIRLELQQSRDFFWSIILMSIYPLKYLVNLCTYGRIKYLEKCRPSATLSPVIHSINFCFYSKIIIHNKRKGVSDLQHFLHT